jgi:hypothetical protein
MIKTSIILISFFIATFSLNAENIGINFGTFIQPTNFNNKFALISGGKLGINYSKNYYIGIALSSNTLFKHSVNGYDSKATMNPTFEINFYGLDLEYFIYPDDPINFSFGAIAGRANIFFSVPQSIIDKYSNYFPEYINGKSSLVLQPNFNVNFFLKDFYRIVVGVSYKYFPGFDYTVPELVNQNDNSPYSINSSDISGFSLNFGIRFGSF